MSSSSDIKGPFIVIAICLVVGPAIQIALVAAAPHAAAAAQPKPLAPSQPAPAPSAQPAPPRAPATPPSQPLAARLDALEHAAKYADIGLLILSDAPALDPADRAAAIAWLSARQASGRMPVLFLLARLHEVAGDSDAALKWFLAADCLARIDAQRCQDPSAAQAVPVLEQHFPALKGAFLLDSALAAKLLPAALDLEERLRDREPPYWIAAHGIAAFSGQPPAFISDDEWRDRRRTLRDAFAGRVASAD